jgi:hypothetical protein
MHQPHPSSGAQIRIGPHAWPPETDTLIGQAAAAAAAWPPHAPAGAVRRQRLTIALRPDGMSAVECILYSHRRLRQAFGFIGPSAPAARQRDSRPDVFLRSAPPPVVGPPGTFVQDATLHLWLPREGAPGLARVSDAPLPDLGVVGHPDLDGPGGAPGALAHAFTLAARAAAARLPDGLHPLLPMPEDSAHARLAAAGATALLPDAARAALDGMVRNRDAGWRPTFLVAERAAVLLLIRPGRTPRHLASAALRRA